MKIIICGGHVTPALAVIEKIKEQKPSTEIIFLGRKNVSEKDKSLSFEYQLISELPSVKFINIITGKFQRFFSLYNLWSILKIPAGFLQSIVVLLREKPQVILSFGGYISLPVVFAGWVLRTPIVIHEQSFTYGLANKLTAFMANKICLSQKSSLPFFPQKKTVITGNPLRSEVFKINKNSPFYNLSQSTLPKIYVTGGNMGAHFINCLIEKNLEKLLSLAIVIHQCGANTEYNDGERLQKIKNQLPQNLKERYFPMTHIFPKDIGTVFAISDLIIGRAGANTIWEIWALFKKAILIPLPIGFEQEKNAKFLIKNRLVEILKQDKITGEILLVKIKQLLKRKITSTKDVSFHRQAAEKVAREVFHALS